MAFNSFRKKSYVGLDLGHHTIKAVQLDRTSDGWKLSRFGSIPTPEESIRDSIVVDSQIVGAAIKQLLRECEINAASAIIAVAGGSVVVRTVRIPIMPEATLRRSIKFEAGRYVPSSVEDSHIEFEIIGPVDDTQMDILVVAVPREIVASRIKACDEAGLNVEIVDVEPFAAYRVFVESDQDSELAGKTVALVDIGATTTSMSVVSNGVFVMTRSIQQAGQSLTEALKNQFKLSKLDAEAGKAQLDINELSREGAPKDNPPLRVIQPLIDDLVREVRRSLNYFQSQQTDGGQAKAVDVVLLSGGGSKMNGLANYFESKLGIPTKTVNVATTPSFTVESSEEANLADLSVASGLALRAFHDAA